LSSKFFRFSIFLFSKFFR